MEVVKTATIVGKDGKPEEIYDGMRAPEATKMPEPLVTDAPFVRNKKTGVVFPANIEFLQHSDLVEPCYNLEGSTNPNDLRVPKAQPRLIKRVEEAEKPRDVVADTAAVVAAVLQQLGIVDKIKAPIAPVVEQVLSEQQPLVEAPTSDGEVISLDTIKQDAQVDDVESEGDLVDSPIIEAKPKAPVVKGKGKVKQVKDDDSPIAELDNL